MDAIMVLVHAKKDSEESTMPQEQRQQVLTEMGGHNEELIQAGVSLPRDGLHPSSNGARGANRMAGVAEIEIRQLLEAEAFGDAATPEIRAQEARLREPAGARQKS